MRGSIPACAGEPASSDWARWSCWVYPRVCGGTRAGRGHVVVPDGLSPRVRGNQASPSQSVSWSRSIPACAGEPPRSPSPELSNPVYPRVCGGTAALPGPHPVDEGLSPRVRGNLDGLAAWFMPAGSIPACAGEPWSGCSICRANWVYPRVCGGTHRMLCVQAILSGLSPRVRGNQSRAADYAYRAGSIPACAGEPCWGHAGGVRSKVYPRVCGGTQNSSRPSVVAAGLSPRVRGNRARLRAAGRAVGSIPACAGEPGPVLLLQSGGEVYPRVCGGTTSRFISSAIGRGLSPRVRGNLITATSGPALRRSIPACAGEPTPSRSPAVSRKVYPRVCGGTGSDESMRSSLNGLSPRVRGNPAVLMSTTTAIRSIPACAGEPRTAAKRRWPSGVYPRVCGGTGSTRKRTITPGGLSPRVRGNLTKGVIPWFQGRSIPACAGEPRICPPAQAGPEVYPRVCGGTPRRIRSAAWLDGLSPRVRGNPGGPRSYS